MVFIVPAYLLTFKITGEDMRYERDREFRKEYRELLNSLSSSVSGGASIENAFLMAEKELKEIFGDESCIVPSVHKVNMAVRLRTPVEKAFFEFADEEPYREVREFANVFSFAKRLGGGYTEDIKRSAAEIGERLELVDEIEAMTSEKRFELKIMSVMPALILLYIGIVSPDFTAPLYGEIKGIGLMTAMLIVYVFAILFGRKIIRRGECL